MIGSKKKGGGSERKLIDEAIEACLD